MAKPSPFTIINNIPAEYTALSDAISELLYTMGSKNLCGACFRGHLGALAHGQHNEMGLYVSRGCCGSCANSQPTGCVQKPVGCAGYQCPALSMLIPERITRAINRVRYLAFRTPRNKRNRNWHYTPGSGCYDYALKDVAVYPYSRDQLVRFARYTVRVKRITAWVVKSGWHPNWPLVELASKARVSLGGVR